MFASGGGTNLQSLLDRCRPPEPATVTLVVSNRRDAGALRRAEAAGVSTHVLDNPGDGAAIVAVLEDAGIDLVVLAGYLKLIPPAVVAAYAGRMINIHPALLPAFGGAGMYGHRVHEAVLASGAAVTGVTIHLVSEEYDRGSILAQWPVPVHAGDSADTLAARVLAVEHELLPLVVLAAARRGGSEPLRLDHAAFAAAPTTRLGDTLLTSGP